MRSFGLPSPVRAGACLVGPSSQDKTRWQVAGSGRKYEMGADECVLCCVVFCVRECVLGLTAPTLQQNRGGSRRQEPVPVTMEVPDLMLHDRAVVGVFL